MDKQQVVVKGSKPVPKEMWDEICRNAPHVDLSGGPEVLEEKWRNAPRLERTDEGVALIPAEQGSPPMETE